MNAGSAFGVGNTMYVAGITTHKSNVGTGLSPAKVIITRINNNVGDVIRISGIRSDSYSQYNDIYRIQSIAVGAAKSFSVIGNKPITGVTTAGIGTVVAENALFTLTGKPIGISTFTLDVASGIATVGTSTFHGLGVNSKVTIENSFVGVRTDGDTPHAIPTRELGDFTGDFVINKVGGDQRLSLIHI